MYIIRSDMLANSKIKSDMVEVHHVDLRTLEFSLYFEIILIIRASK